VISLPQSTWLEWTPRLIWLHIVADSTVAFSCFAIQFALIKIIRRRHVPFGIVFYAVSAFLVACGVSHAIDVLTLWHPLIWMSGMSKALTAGMALITLIAMLRYTPEILALPSHAELQKAVWELNSLLESTSTCVLAVDHDWRVDYLNRRARTVLNVSGEARRRTLWEIFPPGTQQSREKLCRVMETREPTAYEEYHEALDLWTTVQAHPWDNGGITLFFNDESEQRQLRHELHLHGLRDQRIEILARLSGELAHEIKNPLAIIHARASDLAEIAEEVASVPAAQVSLACESIVKTSDRAIRILRGLAALAREGTHDPMQLADMSTIVDQIVELVAPRCRTHGISLEKSVPAGLPLIQCREVQIGQVLMNLLNNAFDAVNACPEAARWVRVQVGTTRLEPKSSATEERVYLDVIDGGPGVAPEAKAKIMQSFYTTKPVGEGIGIGLSVSRSIALDHGGTLELLEPEGKTCFRLMIPVAAKPTQTNREEIAA
jgi:C4-dicarboxylate-specific signal transduction histidine kinase